VGAARADSPDSANSQFFIMYAPHPELDNNYTVMGRVVSGMDAVDGIAPGEPPDQPTKIVRMWLGDGAPASAAAN
jgi:peptidylprolyl isomerase